MPKYKYTLIYFDDEIDESNEIHFVNPMKNCHLCSVSGDDYDFVLEQRRKRKSKYWVGEMKDARLRLKHTLPLIEE